MTWEVKDDVLHIKIPLKILPPEIPLEALGMPALTPRELETLPLIVAGKCNKEIGCALGISERTVKFHVSSLLGKFHVTSRWELRRVTYG
jgi:DNA-binding NarL/FixJ family response regulator